MRISSFDTLSAVGQGFSKRPHRGLWSLGVAALSLTLLHAVPSEAAQTVLAWGLANSGQLGNNGTTDQPMPLDVTNSGDLEGKTIVQIGGGANYSVALCSDGTLAAWGYNAYGQLGTGDTVSQTLPVSINNSGALAGRRVVQLSTGYNYSLALCSDGTVLAWGYNGQSQLGNNNTTNRLTPTNISSRGVLSGKRVVQVSCADSHSMALCSDGTIAAWGFNGQGQVGDGTTTNRAVPVDITGKGALAGKTVVQIEGGYYHTIALCSDGTVVAWGGNNYGQLGTGNTTNQSLPLDITNNGALSGKTVTRLVCDYSDVFALCSDGSVVAWGYNAAGQLGNGDTNNQLSPLDISNQGALAGKTVVQVAEGLNHTLALCNDGTLASWGANASGQLGTGNTTPQLLPVDIRGQGDLGSTGEQVTQVAAGGYHSLALSMANSAPVAQTGAATSITSTGATLGATVNATGLVTTAKIEYGTDTNYGSEVNLTLTPDDGVADLEVSAAVMGLGLHTTYHYRVSANNSLGTTVGEDATFRTNGAPTDITLSRNTVAEQQPIGSFVGQLSSSDPDSGAGETFTYSIVGGDTNAFAIDGAFLRTAQVFDEGVKNSYNLTIRTTDSGGLFYEEAFTINVTESSKPTVTLSSPTNNQQVLITGLVGNIISGSATDNKGVAAVKVRLSRKRGTVNSYWNGTDFVSTQTYLDASVTTAGGQSVSWTLAGQLPSEGKLDTGLYNVQVYAQDNAGNKSAYASGTFTILDDVTAPTLSISTPTLSQKLLIEDFDGFAVSGRAEDDGAMSSVRVRLSRKRGTTNYYWNGTDFGTTPSWVEASFAEGGWNLGTSTPEAEQLDSGGYQVEAYALDGAGNKSATAKVSFSLGSDYIAPSLSIVTPTPSQVIGINSFGAGTMTGTAGDNKGVVSVKLKLQRKRGTVISYWNGTNFTETLATVDASYDGESGTWSYDSAIPALALDAGGYTLYATAFDAAGNKTTSASRSFSIVGTPSVSGAISAVTASSAGGS